MPGEVALRVLPHRIGTPAYNMAVDEAILLAGGAATLRLYGWEPPGLSLGYFQRAGCFADVPGRHRIVRRLTGGGAIYHEHELTFSLILDADLLPASVDDGYALVHDAMAAALAEVGVRTTRLHTGAAPAPRPEQLWCFAEPGSNDLIDAEGRKLLGSAQRRIARPRPRVLHHGSLVLRRPAATPFCAAVADTVDPDTVLTELGRSATARIAGVLGLPHEAGYWTEAELEAAARLERERYASEAFTYRR